jgi:predicted RNA polymerase sigma factor
MKDLGVIYGSTTKRAERVAAVRHVLYPIFDEGSTAVFGAALPRVELTDPRRPARPRPDGAPATRPPPRAREA